MRSEPIEVGLEGKLTIAPEGTRRAGVPRRSDIAPHVATTATTIIDEAFASLPRQLPRHTRIDAAAPTSTALTGLTDNRGTIRAEIAQLSAQLEALDKQRHRLAQLLREIESPPLAD
jgi:hypothetical protein